MDYVRIHVWTTPSLPVFLSRSNNRTI